MTCATHPGGVSSEGDRTQYVSTPEALGELIAAMKGSSVLAIDTEFLRERTYYAKLCLVQLATDDGIEAIVDPLSVRDLTQLSELLSCPTIVKVLHSASQDVEVLLRATGVTPRPIFDTQIAASIMGQSHQIGYGLLVHELCGVDLPKADSLTDWSRRPLSRTQLQYAIDDVRYLPRMYAEMHDELERLGRSSWAQPDFERLEDPDSYRNDPRRAWRKLKRVSSLSRKQLAAAREVAAWREETAQQRDLPRRWVLADEVVVEIARHIPKTPEDVLRLRGVSGRMSTATIRKLIERIDNAVNAEPYTWPEAKHRVQAGVDVEAGIDLLTALTHLRARENNVSPSLLATHNEIVKVAGGQTDDIDVLTGWRKAIVGDDMLALLDGKLLLSIDDHHLKVTDLRQEAGDCE